MLANPAVARLDGGPFGSVATYLPGRRVVGVRVGAGGVELAVVARLGTLLPQLAEELGALVRGLLGPLPVDVTVSDVVGALPATPPAPPAPPSTVPTAAPAERDTGGDGAPGRLA